ncbi:hypothetical protein [Salinisphaera hydrothermalis]|uniref:hypothetical protein n=1 Tax=Salinisphaera hydrothermalis TaxID=563188 RepID=UPI00334164EC
MLTRFHTGGRTLLATLASTAALALAVPAFAQTQNADTSIGNAGSLPAGQSSQPMQSATPSAQNDNGDSSANASNDNTPAPQQLPEPKPSDYGASNFHAPSDTELAEFAATHQPPAQNNNGADDANGPNADSNNGNAMNSANDAGPSASGQTNAPTSGTPSNDAAATSTTSDSATSDDGSSDDNDHP